MPFPNCSECTPTLAVKCTPVLAAAEMGMTQVAGMGLDSDLAERSTTEILANTKRQLGEAGCTLTDVQIRNAVTINSGAA